MNYLRYRIVEMVYFFKKPHITKLSKPILLKSKIRSHFCTPFQNLTTGTSIMRTRQLASLLKILISLILINLNFELVLIIVLRVE